MELIRVGRDYRLAFPRDLSVVSFDNSALADLPDLPLTSINHPSQYMGATAANLLLEKVRDGGIRTSTVTIIEPELIERNSVTDLRDRTFPVDRLGEGEHEFRIRIPRKNARRVACKLPVGAHDQHLHRDVPSLITLSAFSVRG